MSMADHKKIVDLASRGTAKKRKAVRCLTILLDEKPKLRPTSMRQATPEEMERRRDWTVGVFHRAAPTTAAHSGPATPAEAKLKPDEI
jgi:hypothetical protein